MMFSTTTENVLIVEDDPVLRAMYTAMLRLEGFAVVGVEDGVDALRHLEVNHPSAVVLDLGLPRLCGRDVQLEIRNRIETSTIPIVIVTGEDTGDLDPRDFACILRKPIDLQSLVTAVRDCLRKTPA
jgi:DNA-binding response OmpR family regulator